MKDERDRRKYPRIPKVTLVSITQAGLKQSIPALMVDISLGGMRALTREFIQESRAIVLSIESYEGEKIEIPAKIMWWQKTDIMSDFSVGVGYMNGFEFKAAPEEVKEKIFDRFGIVDFLGWTGDLLEYLEERKSKGRRKRKKQQ